MMSLDIIYHTIFNIAIIDSIYRPKLPSLYDIIPLKLHWVKKYYLRHAEMKCIQNVRVLPPSNLALANVNVVVTRQLHNQVLFLNVL
jgi:hypothetical protein